MQDTEETDIMVLCIAGFLFLDQFLDCYCLIKIDNLSSVCNQNFNHITWYLIITVHMHMLLYQAGVDWSVQMAREKSKAALVTGGLIVINFVAFLAKIT